MLTNYFYIEMKKILFGALCASAFLASCSNDELELNSAIGVEGGEKIEVLLGATYPEYVDEANTRMTLVGNEWAWINGDMLGGCMINASSNVVSNYPFFLTDTLEAPTKNVTFKTNTAVYAGDYIFYHQYKTDLISGTDITVNFPILQVIDPENPTAHVSEQNMWVSPKIKLGGIKYGENNKTAIKFVGMNAVLKLNITNNSDYDKVVINKVVVNGTTGAFYSKGTLDITNDFSTALDASAQDYATKLDEKIAGLNAASADLISSSSPEKVNDISAIISGEGISLAQDAEATVYVLIPAGKYGIGATASETNKIKTITIYTDKGSFTIAAENARSGANKGTVANSVDFNRNSVLNLYPELEGKASDVETYYVNNEQDWDNAVAYALANTNKKIVFELVNDLTIDELPNCALYVEGDKDLTLKEGKEYNLYRGSEFASIINKGTLNLVDNVTVTTLVNNGTVKIAKTEEITGSVVTTLTNNGTIDLEGSMTTASGWTNVYDEADEEYGTINVKSGAKLILGVATTNAGVINNAGTINVASNALTNEGEINVATATGKFVGAQDKITNNGAIKLDAIKDVFVGADGKAVENSFITVASTGTVEVAVSPSDIATLPAIQEINAISMSGSWTIENVTDMNAKWSGITAMTWEGVSLDLNEVNDEFDAVESLTINGTSAITTSGTEKATMNLADAEETTITVKGDLTIGKNVAITSAGATATPVMKVLGTVVNSGEVTVLLTVGAEKNTTATYTNTKDGKTFVKSDSSSDDVLTLYGIFINEGEKENVTTTNVDFKVNGESTFKGNYTDTDAA